jgi:serine/threonine protein kinase
VVHRDFKPTNVIVGDDGRVRVVDFGLARLERDTTPDPEGTSPDAPPPPTATRTGAFVGTPRYMAPEQYLRKRADARSDQFAFAVTAYEVLFGRPPFDADSLEELERSIVSGRVKKPPRRRDVPSGIEWVLERALRTDPAARYDDVRQLLAALEEAARRRSKKPLVLAGLGVLAGAAVVSGWLSAPSLPSLAAGTTPASVHAAVPLKPAPPVETAALPAPAPPPKVAAPPPRKAGKKSKESALADRL